MRDQTARPCARAPRRCRPEDLRPSTRPAALLAPQVLINVDHQMRVMREESFGPVVGIMKVADDAEAIALMNDCPMA